MLEQNDKQKDVAEDAAINGGESAATETQADVATVLSREFSSEQSQIKSIPFTSISQLVELTKSPDAKADAQGNESDKARKSLSSEILTSFQESLGAREEKLEPRRDAATPPIETPSLSITDIVSDLPKDGPGDDNSSDGSIKTSYFKTKLSKDLLRGAKHTSDHVANIHAESAAKSFHNQIDALPTTGAASADAVSKPTQIHILTIDKPESFKDLERTTGGVQEQSSLLATPPNVEAFPQNPPAITIHKPNIETEKPGRASGANGATTVGGEIARPGDGTDVSSKDKLPTINSPIGDKVPLEKLPGSSDINIPIDKLPKPGHLVLSPIDVKGPKNKDTIDLPVTGIPHIGDKFPSPASVQLGTINVGKEPEHKLHSDPAVSTLPIPPAFGLPIYTSINDTKSPAANSSGNGQMRELPATTFSRSEPVSTVAQVSRYSSQEWMSSITSQARTEEKAKTVITEQERLHNETQRKELQREQQKELQRTPVAKSQAQTQIDSFRARNEQSIPAELLRNPTLIAYNAIPQGAAEKVFAGRVIGQSGESQLMRNTSAVKNTELAMPQPFKLSNMDKALFVPANHKATSLEATVKGFQRESTAIANISKLEFAAKHRLVPAEQNVVTQQKSDQKVSSVKAFDAGKISGEAKLEAKVDLQQSKSAQKVFGATHRNEISVPSEKAQQSRASNHVNEQGRPDGARKLESSARNDQPLRFDPTQKIDASKQKPADLTQNKIEPVLHTSHKFVQIKPELISVTEKAESNSAQLVSNKLERGFANKIIFAGTVASDSMAVLQNARKTAAGAGEIGCTKKGENNRFFPGSELTLAAVLALAGARKRRGEEQSRIISTASSEMAKQVLHRRTYMVEAGDTLQSIAERFYDRRDAAGLIVNLNALSITEQSIDGRTIIELRVRQILELPEAEEVSNYLATLSKNYNVEKLVTIVKENNVDVELLRDFLGKVCDDKAAAQVAKPVGANAALPAKAELPELVIDDDKTLPPASGLGAVVTDLALLISNGLKRPARDMGALS